jgi:hypothetical protein
MKEQLAIVSQYIQAHAFNLLDLVAILFYYHNNTGRELSRKTETV